MGKDIVESELKRVIYLAMIISMTILDLLIITLSFLLGWEFWMIPVVIAGAAICWGLSFTGRVSHRMQTYICGFFGMFLVFYYSVKIQTVYDCGTVIFIMIFLFAFTREKALTVFGVISSFLSLIFHLTTVHNTVGLKTDSRSSVVRTVMVFVMIPFAVVLVEVIVRAWETSEKTYIKKIAELSEENERANNFLANVSHEVRTPVGAVMGLSYVLLKENIESRFKEKIRAIAEAGQRASEQITDILDFTEIEMKKVAVNNESYMISSLVNDLMVQLDATDSEGLDLVVDVETNTPNVLIGDAAKIRRVLWHLIRNGFKYTKEGGIYVHIYPVKREYGINLVMEIKDTGIGMREDELDNIYEKYYQADSGRSRKKGGLGLGVPIVNGFVKAMSGVLTIESKVGEGTLVKVSIPQEIEDGSPSISVKDARNCVVAGFLGFMTTGHPKIREYYMQMITHMSIGLGIPFHRVQSAAELKKVVESQNVTHLFVGTGEYLNNREYMDDLSKHMNVALVADRGFNGEVSADLLVMPKPFGGIQVANILNHTFSTENEEEKENITFPGLKALVVDDEHMNLIVAREIFSAYGMEISTAGSGVESIDMCEKNDYDIVFMDHMMPGMDGVEAMHRIKSNASKNNKEVCVVALTANAISSAREMFMSEGFDGFVSKPIEISELERVLKRVIPASKIVYIKEPLKTRKVKNMGLSVTAKPVESPEDAIEIPAAEVPAVAAADPITALKEAGVDTDHGLDYCGGDMEFYQELLLDYADKKEDKLKEIQGYFDEKDWKNYEIRVHGIKSTSALIGALTLSEEAKKLEFAAKGDDIPYITENHEKMFKVYESLMETIHNNFGDTEGGAS